MAARYEVDLNIASARNLKNVNWRHGDLKPYVVAWVDPAAKSSTKVAVGGDDDDPIWDEKLVLPLPYGLPLEDATLSLDVVHAGSGEGVKPLVGSVRLPLRDVLDEVGLGSKLNRTLKLKRPSGRPHGKLEVTVAVKEPARYYDAYAPPYGQASSRDYGYAPPPYTPTPYATAPTGYPYAQPPTGYPYGGPPAGGYAYGAQQPPVAYGQQEKSKSKFGMGTGLAVGAAAGLLGGLALAEGVDYVEDKIADDVTERVEDDLAEDGDYDGDDF
ncbi:unnamed protein product [Musa acuminata subsp. malaccensis]|uniref:(wild Malaysian banana) hypothetical protein n=1 Tax=Musa acuminata subsp. malaccensis TaxID=214687 RepID=A0A804L594_MUSAM|nr:PREDICTED: protein SRC2-like [Musa acuminata subsp. malaccensis]CAG1863817.1 unnamed protein product [Musa acuminata subsp. malaccensis]